MPNIMCNYPDWVDDRGLGDEDWVEERWGKQS